jgi:hypothetical protein
VGLTYDGNDVLLVANGNIEGRLTAPGAITARNASEIAVLSANGSDAFEGQRNGFCVFNRGLSLGELRKLMRAGDNARTTESTTTAIFFDQVCNSNAAITAAAQTRFCGSAAA